MIRSLGIHRGGLKSVPASRVFHLLFLTPPLSRWERETRCPLRVAPCFRFHSTDNSEEASLLTQDADSLDSPDHSVVPKPGITRASRQRPDAGRPQARIRDVTANLTSIMERQQRLPP